MTVESEKDLAGLRRVGRVVGLALSEMKENPEPGMTTGELDGVGARVFERFGARSAPQLVYGFPGVNCISRLGDEVTTRLLAELLLTYGGYSVPQNDCFRSASRNC
jgi:methionine aminopeptidase